MYVADKNFVLPDAVKQALHRKSEAAGGFGADGSCGWITCDGFLFVWPVEQGSYAAVVALLLPTRNINSVHAFRSGGGLTVAACSNCGQLFTWLDATVQSAPQHQVLAQAGPGSEANVVATFQATAYTGPDAPGYLGVVSLADGSLIFVSVTAQGTAVQEVDAGATAVPPRGGLLKAIGGAVVGQYAGFGELINLKGLRRSHASSAPAVHAYVAHQGGPRWLALVLTPEALDCWQLAFLANGKLAAHCQWSLSVSASVAQCLPHFRCSALSFALQGQHLCMLCAIERAPGGVDRTLALAFHTLPAVEAHGATAGLPVCHSVSVLPARVPSDAASTAEVPWRIALRHGLAAALEGAADDHAGLSLSPLPGRADGGASGAVVLLSGRMAVDQAVSGDPAPRGAMLAWAPPDSCECVLSEVTDAMDVCWSAQQRCWQALSPIYGVLCISEGDTSVRQHLSAAPLLDAAVSRYLAGFPPPGLAEALAVAGALDPSTMDLRNAVEDFSQRLADSLQKDVASNAAVSLSALLQQKQQRHNALLQCLYGAGLLGASTLAAPKGAKRPEASQLLDQRVVAAIFEHSEMLAAFAALRSSCAAATAPSADDAAGLAGPDSRASTCSATFKAVYENAVDLWHSAGGGGSADMDAEVKVYSSPVAMAEAVLTGLARTARACSTLEQLDALHAMLSALLQGVASAQRSLLSRFGADYRRAAERCGPGWAAGAAMRAACVELLSCAQALSPAAAGGGAAPAAAVQVRKRKLLLALARRVLDRFSHAVSIVAGQERPAEASALLGEAQEAACALLGRLYCDLNGLRSDRALHAELRGELQALAATRLFDARVADDQKITSVQWLFRLLDEELHDAHAATCAQAASPLGKPLLCSWGERLLPLLPSNRWPTALAKLPDITDDEKGILARLHGHMAQNMDFRQHVMTELVASKRVVELLLLPPNLHASLQTFLRDRSLPELEWLLGMEARDFAGAADALQRLYQAPGAEASLLCPRASNAALQRKAAVLRKTALLLEQRRVGREGAPPPATRAKLGEELAQCDAVVAAADVHACVRDAFASIEDQLPAPEVLLTAASSLGEQGGSRERQVEALLASVKLACLASSSRGAWIEAHRNGAWAAVWRAMGALDGPALAAAVQQGGQDQYVERQCAATTLVRALKICRSFMPEYAFEARSGGIAALSCAREGVCSVTDDPQVVRMAESLFACAW